MRFEYIYVTGFMCSYGGFLGENEENGKIMNKVVEVNCFCQVEILDRF